MKLDDLLTNVKSIVNRTACKTLLNNNANKASERIPVMRDLVAGEVAKHIALTDLLPSDIADAHISGDIHYHDLDYAPLFPSFNCMLIDLKNMLQNGFKMGNADIEQPKSITTAANITAQIIAQVSSHIYGGNTINRIDEVLAPYVKKSYNKHLSKGLLWFDGDEKKSAVYARIQTEKECYDAFQILEYQIQTLFTSNGQSPFCTINFGLGLSWESKLIQESILKIRLKGLGKSKRTAIFPKLIFTLKDGVNLKEGDPNYDIKLLALECASKRIYPDIINYDKLVEVTGGFKAAMGCRSFLGEYKGEYEGRNNLGVVSINLPRISLLANKDKDKFFDILDNRLELTKRALLTRIDRLKDVKANVAPIIYVEGACGVKLKPDDNIIDIMKNGRASISVGYIGLHEMAINMGYDNPCLDRDSESFVLSVMKYMKDKINEWKEEDGWGYSLYSTPSESLCDRFWRLDKKQFGPLVDNKGYYTNSFHADVSTNLSPLEKIDYESKFPQYASGGFISYVELPNMERFLKTLEDIWDYTYDKLPYFGINMPVDYCGKCDFSGETIATENGFTCPSCGNHDSSTLQVTRRVAGYLGSPNARPFIEGKQKEVMSRVKHY